MAAIEQDLALGEADAPQGRGLWPKRWRFRISLGLLGLVLFTLAVAWFARERIAGNIIDDLLHQYDLQATYDIVSIDPRRQVIANLVVGDPARPDFTAERVVIDLGYRFGTPTVSGVELVSPRLFGTYLDGKLSFGSLDRVIFAETEEPPALPALDITIRDGRVLIESDYGAIAAKLDGSGPLDDGFAGKLAVTAPEIGTENCRARTATLYGDITTTSGSPSFAGSMRLGDLDCNGAKLARADANVKAALADDFSSVGGKLTISASDAGYEGNTIASLSGEIDFNSNKSGLNLGHDLAANDFTSPFGSVREVRANGTLRSDGDLVRTDWSMDLSGAGLDIYADTSSVLANASSAAAGTLLAPLLAKFERNLARAVSNGRVNAALTVRMNDGRTTVLIPQGTMTGAGGDTVMALSRFAWSNADEGMRLSGNFVTGGEGLPRINGRMEQAQDGTLALRATMAEYAEGADRLAIPRLQLMQDRTGGISFNGLVTAGGALPGGSVDGLLLPVEGVWSEAGGLALGRRCSEVRFGALTLAQLSLQGRRLAICPQPGRAMVRYDDDLRIGIETRDLALNGKLADSPTILSASAARYSYPGGFALDDLQTTIGEEGSAVRLSAAEVNGDVGDAIGGSFARGTAALDIVPLDLSDMAGRWAYRDETLIIDEGAFQLSERIDGVEVLEARFRPLAARDATLSLSANVITALAELRHPGTSRLVTRVDVVHDLNSGAGRAEIAVPGVTFDDQMRPRDLTPLTEGVIALADGTITGQGEIDWTPDGITSGGTFSTQGLDLAAAFGPIDGVNGTIVFTDLINLTTAPNQVIEIGALNPGIEVLGGRVQFSLTNGEVISVEDARWPFMGGELILRPVDIRYGQPGKRRYVFEVVALDAAAFVAQMEFGNIGASGVFDGTVPILFDDNGNGYIEDGLLISRPPGGNVSYVGELTYKDLGAFGDFAFQSLRSLDYNQMSVGLSGDLAGEIITSFRIDGVRQGEGASRNILTRRLASLPIKFRINIRSQSFFQLGTIARLYLDPSSVRDPRALGLFREENGRLVPINRGPTPPAPKQNQPEDEPPVQPEAIQNRESEEMP